jgi:hypothetical protein
VCGCARTEATCRELLAVEAALWTFVRVEGIERLRALRKKVRNLPADCAKLFEDETDLLLFPPPRAGWFLRGKPAEVPISGENAKRTVFGTIDAETGQRIFVSRDGACGPDFQAILRLVR